MARKNLDKNMLRILDANINRAKEGLRVCEDEARFILNDARYSRQLKSVRHKISSLSVGSRKCSAGVT
ncbi:hypothetical protein ACFL38_05570 [Candidatus Omnitrophota bacterium]